MVGLHFSTLTYRMPQELCVYLKRVVSVAMLNGSYDILLYVWLGGAVVRALDL